MFRKSLTLLVVAGILATFGLLASAYFTSQATVTNNTFTTGTLNLTVAPTTAALTFNNMAPGDAVTAPITVTNSGSLALRYAMTSTSTNTDSKGLAAQMTLAIKSGVTACTNGGFAASGTSIYSGTLGSALFGDPATGSQAGDRTLVASANEVLCFQATLPANSGNAYQSAATTATFTFDAEQTANNP
ncbi:spore coat-associated protein N [Anaerolineae bacterium]|nr:spore coat-associated protein N [Anaerolineae bacterium]